MEEQLFDPDKQEEAGLLPHDGVERKMCGTPFDTPLPICDFEMQSHAATMAQGGFGYQGFQPFMGGISLTTR